MVLNKVKGNMYSFCTHTFNIIKGRCKHDCVYCYMKRFPQKALHFDEAELKTDLGEGNFIFVGSSTDMFARDVPDEWISETLKYCTLFKNKYLFQTKNPERISNFFNVFPKEVVIGTTIESNRDYNLSESPTPIKRAESLSSYEGFIKMITLEPLFDFDLDELIELIKMTKPTWVNIGADSNYRKRYNCPEPSKEKIMKLIEELNKFTEVKVKDNLNRLIK